MQAAPAAPGWRALAEAPFGFERRRSSVLCEGEGRRLLVVKGAPEAVLAACTAAEGADGAPGPMTETERAALLARAEARVAEGLRLLGVAWRPPPDGEEFAGPSAERDLVFAGFCAFLDPPKRSAADAVARLGALGVRVKIVSGDAAPVVLHLVQALGLPCRGLLTGEEIEALDHPGLVARVDDVDLYARVSPDQKRRVILALKAHGRTVGFIGDGINDAPAIHAADAGLSVEGATEVARAAADMPLSSVFDFATFGVLLWGFGATPEEFRTAWFVESMATQVLVIFLIRTHGPVWGAVAPHPALVATSLSALAAALGLALGPLAGWFGFQPLPGAVLGAILGLVGLYLAAAEVLKRRAARAGTG